MARPVWIAVAAVAGMFAMAYGDASDIDMVPVKGGTYIMGCAEGQSDCRSDETPARKVTVGDFLIGRYEVTQGQWKSVMPYIYSLYTGNDNLPVDNVSWNEVQEFILKLNAKTGKKYRLPTEAEWEYAARGGEMSAGREYAGGDSIDSVAWYYDNSSKKTHPVGSKQPNELGIHDMSGNLWEWVDDWYAPYPPSDETDPRGPPKGAGRIYRGGGWGNKAVECRVSIRTSAPPGNRGRYLGFRLAHDVD